MRIILNILAVACCLFLTCGCHGTEPSPEHEGSGQETPGQDADDNPDNPDEPGGDRPGGDTPDDDYDFTPEESDATPRYVSRLASLRYDSPGILVKTFNSNRVEFYDLDGNARAIISWGEIGLNDGVARDAVLEVNGADIALSKLQRMARKDGSIWFLCVDVKGMRHVIVVPDPGVRQR